MKWKECVIFVLDIQRFFYWQIVPTWFTWWIWCSQSPGQEAWGVEPRDARGATKEVCVGGQDRFNRIQSYDRPIGQFFSERKVAKYNMKHVQPWWKPEGIASVPWCLGILNPIRKSPMKCPRSVWNVVPDASSTRNRRKEKSKPCYVERLWPIGIAVGIFIPHLGSRKNCLFSSVLHPLKAKVSKLFKTNEINKLSDNKWN